MVGAGSGSGDGRECGLWPRPTLVPVRGVGPFVLWSVLGSEFRAIHGASLSDTRGKRWRNVGTRFSLVSGAVGLPSSTMSCHLALSTKAFCHLVWLSHFGPLQGGFTLKGRQDRGRRVKQVRSGRVTSRFQFAGHAYGAILLVQPLVHFDTRLRHFGVYPNQFGMLRASDCEPG